MIQDTGYSETGKATFYHSLSTSHCGAKAYANSIFLVFAFILPFCI